MRPRPPARSHRSLFRRAATTVFALALTGSSAMALAQPKVDTLRLGYQKAASLLVLQKAQGSRGGVANNYFYYLGERRFAERRPDVIKALFEDSVEQGHWIKSHLKQASAIIAPVQGLDAEIVESALRRYQFGVAPVTDAIATEQQRIADVFFELKLIPKTVRIADALKPAAKVAVQ